MRSFLRLTTLVASLLMTAWAVPEKMLTLPDCRLAVSEAHQ